MVKVLTLNFRKNWNRKKGLIQHLVTETNPDIVLLQETGKANIHLPNYKSYQFKAILSETTGIATLVKGNLRHHELKLDQIKGTELLGISLHIGKSKQINIINCYIHNNQINLGKIRETLKLNNIGTYLIGDTNCKLDIPQHNKTNPNGDKLQRLINRNKIACALPVTYTRYDANHSNSIIDMALTNPRNRRKICDIKIEKDIGSDHLPVTFTIREKPMTIEPTCTNRPNFDKAIWDAYRDDIDRLMQDKPNLDANKQSIDRAIAFITETLKT